VDSKRIFLSEKELPAAWYNLQADLPTPLPPPLHPGTKQPLSPSDLEPIFSKALIAQEMSRERWIEIPEPVREVYKIWRPTPLVRALNLEKALKTPARIYYKDESVSPPGSHKPNSAVPQAYYNKIEGIEHLATETGAGLVLAQRINLLADRAGLCRVDTGALSAVNAVSDVRRQQRRARRVA